MSENNKSLGDLFPDLGPEVPIISGVAHDSTESLATVRRVPNEPGMAAKVFTMLAEAGVNVDMIVQASASTGTADISFTVPGTAAAKVQEVLQEKQDELGYQSFDVDANVGKVAVVGVGMKTHSGLAAKFFNALTWCTAVPAAEPSGCFGLFGFFMRWVFAHDSRKPTFL